MSDKKQAKQMKRHEKKVLRTNKKEGLKTPWYDFYDDVPFTLEYPNHTIYEHLVATAHEMPNRIAYDYFGTKSTFLSFIKDINECAKALKAAGLEEGETITICMPNTPEGIITFYAANQIGAICSMVHPLAAENEIKEYLKISNSSMLLTLDVLWPKVKKALTETKVRKSIIVSVKNSMPIILKTGFMITKGYKIKKPEYNDQVIAWPSFINGGKDYIQSIHPKMKAKDPAVILYSGGTTGEPKGILLSNYNFNALAIQAINHCANVEPGDKILAILPIFHGFGLGVCFHTVMTLGGTPVMIPQFTPDSFEKLITKHKPNVLIGVPTLFEALLQNSKNKRLDLSFLKLVISGGDSLPKSLKNKIDEFLKDHGADIQVRQGYGLTECVAASCLMPINHYREDSIGIPLPDMYYKIIDPNTGEEVPYGEIGEICISGPTIMMGYVNDEVETNKALRKDKNDRIWLHTGDVGYMSDEGFVFFTQRIKRMIVTSGYNIYPQHIENIINTHPDVLMSTVIGIPHPYKKQVAKAFIVLKSGVKASNKIRKEIQKNCEANLARYSIPKEFEFKASLPKTLIGKVAYRELEKEEAEKFKKN